jgi:hypothetical protein
MDKESSITPSEMADGADNEVISLLKKVQQQLAFLEKKVDLLIGQSQGRPQRERTVQDRPFRKRPFNKPFNSSEPSRYRGRGERGHGPSESDSTKERFYDHHLRGKSRGPIPRKKPFPFKRKDEE